MQWDLLLLRLKHQQHYWFLCLWPHASFLDLHALLPASEVPSQGQGCCCLLSESVALSHRQSSLTHLGAHSTPMAFLHMPKMASSALHMATCLGGLGCLIAIYVVLGVGRTHSFFFHAYIVKEGMTKKIRQKMDKVFSFTPFEVSCPWLCLASYMLLTKMDFLSRRNSILYQNKYTNLNI